LDQTIWKQYPGISGIMALGCDRQIGSASYYLHVGGSSKKAWNRLLGKLNVHRIVQMATDGFKI
jgi:hypothetical protein